MGIVPSGGTDGNTTGKAAGGGAALGLGGSDGGGYLATSSGRHVARCSRISNRKLREVRAVSVT